MESEVSQQQHANSTLTLQNIQNNLNLPLHLYEQVIVILKKYQELKVKNENQQKLNTFKDQLLENVIAMFQTKQNKILNKLQALEQINIKYIQRYIQAKKKGSKSKSNLNISLQLQSQSKIKDKTQIDGQKKLNQQRELGLKNQQDNSDNSVMQLSESIFKSNDWNQLIKEAQNKFNQIQSVEKQQKKAYTKEKQAKLTKILLKCIESYCFTQEGSTKCRKSEYVKQIQELIRIKKGQIEDNKLLKVNIELKNDIRRLKILLQKANSFENRIKELRRRELVQNSADRDQNLALQILQQKVEIENLIEAEICLNQNEGQSSSIEIINRDINNGEFKKRQRQVFNKLCDSILIQLQDDNENEVIQRISSLLNKKQIYNRNEISIKINSIQEYISRIQNESKKDKNIINKLKQQNIKITKQLKQLQILKDKYQFYINQQQQQNNIICNNKQKQKQKQNNQVNTSKITSKINQLFQQSQKLSEKLILKQCLAKKDQLINIQKQQIISVKQNLHKVQNKIISYFQQQGIPFTLSQSNQINLQQLFQNYSKSLTQNAYQRYPQEKTQFNKIAESKYQKIVQLQRQQYQQRIDGYKQEIKHIQLQRDSYKNSMNAQQKQFTKLKQFTQKLVMKKTDLQMQNSKIQQVLKNVLDMMFAYLMSNISYENLLEQIQTIIQNIKACLKYRQREKQRENKQSPMIDYRFSGLSAVSNDYSFSKLNKESYCDYFNQESQIQEESEVISKISSEDQVLPPSRPSYSTTNVQKRQMGMMDINQRATMAHQDQSLIGYLNPVQIRTPRVQFQRNSVLLDGLLDQNIRTIEQNLVYLKNRIPQQTIEVQRQIEVDAKEMYIKYKQALKCLQESQKINQDNEVHYQTFLKQLKEQGVFESKQKTQNKLFYMQKTIKEQEQVIQHQRIQFETTIAKQVIQSQKTMSLLLKNLNKSITQSRQGK